jgi:hypothetical protein
VRGWAVRYGWIGGRRDGWIGGRRDGCALRIGWAEGWVGGFAKVDNRFGCEKWLQGGSIGLALL